MISKIFLKDNINDNKKINIKKRIQNTREKKNGCFNALK